MLAAWPHLNIRVAGSTGAIIVASKVSIFFAELKRRKISRVAAVYVIAGVAFIEAADLIFPRILLPDWTTQLVVIVVLLGFPVAVALAWAFEVKPEEPRQADPPPEANGRKSIVVLPFENLSSDPEQDFFVAGMQDALITELAQISGLRVISRTSAMVFKDRRFPVNNTCGPTRTTANCVMCSPCTARWPTPLPRQCR